MLKRLFQKGISRLGLDKRFSLPNIAGRHELQPRLVPV